MCPQPMTLTFKSEGRTNQLITPCEIVKPFNPFINEKHPSPKQSMALWDTGATNIVISQKVVDELGLIEVSRRRVFHNGGEDIFPEYMASIKIGDAVNFAPIKIS